MQIGIVGLGLIGGSVGLALRDPSRRLVGCDPNPAHEKTARDRFCVDEILPMADVCRSEVVFVAVPPAVTIEVCREALRQSADTVVTDCTSVKQQIVTALDAEPRFVGGHPMAGHEKGGPGFSSAWMFRGAKWLLTPSAASSRESVNKVKQLVSVMGAEAISIRSDEHDRLVATLSHLPHVLAALLVRLAEPLSHVQAAGGSWRDLTRVAGAEPELWSQILTGNREQVVSVLADCEQTLAELRQALEHGDGDAVHEFFSRAKLAKAKHDA
jgi:prephenate dehydrogenase